MSKNSVDRQVRTYMDYSKPIDPVVMVTIPDMDLSYALAGTLVEWDKNKQITSGVAIKWETIGDKTIRFHLRKNLKWSDGSLVDSEQVKRSFENALKRHAEDLRSLSNLIEEFACQGADTIDFKLKVSVKESGLLGKLTEPNYGVLKISPKNLPDLRSTTGPFFVQSESENELVLSRNSNWFKANTEMPEEVIIRRPTRDFNSETALLTDKWANLIETSSMIGAESHRAYEKGHFQVWKRFLDKLGAFQLSSKLANEDGFGLLRYLRKNIDRKRLFDELDGFERTDQAFPHGYPLHDAKFVCGLEADAKLPETFKNRATRILISSARIVPKLRENLALEIERVTGRKPEFKSVSLPDLGTALKAGDYDFYVGPIGMADPDPEGIMSYYFEGDLPMIPKSKEDFVSRLDLARKEKAPEIKIAKMRSILTEATCKGHFLPLYHLSTVGIGRPELDFSNVPLSDESITLSKIRFKRK